MVVVWSSRVSPQLGGYEGLVVVVWSSRVSLQLGGYGGAGGSSLVLQGVLS